MADWPPSPFCRAHGLPRRFFVVDRSLGPEAARDALPAPATASGVPATAVPPFDMGPLPLFSPSVREHLARGLLATAVGVVLLFFFCPPWAAFALWARVPEMGEMLEVRRGVSVLQQIAHPGAPITDPLHAAIQWRLLFPLLGRTLGLPSPVFFALAGLGAFIVLGYVTALLRERGLAWRDTAAATLIVGAASWFFVSTGWLGYFDSWFAFGLLILAFADSRWSMWAACVWAPWVDERFVVAAALALVVRHLDRGRRGASAGWRREFAVAASLLGTFVMVRLGLLSSETASGATITGYFSKHHFLDAPAPRILLGVWEGLRAGWWLVGLGFVAIMRSAEASKLSVSLLAAAILGTAALGLATAQDYSRSMVMLVPAVVYGALSLTSALTGPWRPTALATASALALLLPAHHVMNDAVTPLYYLYHELAALRSPPLVARPELYELRAIHHMERGEFAAAESQLTLAIKLAPHPASPARQRGILLASRGRWADALRDFSLVVEQEPENPEGWFMHAQARFALGELAAARADLDHALALAPEGWGRRPDVSRFSAKLRAAP